MKSQRRAGFVLSYISIFLSSIIGICFTPYLIKQLGQIEYGLYQLLYATIGYIALLDFGLGGTITRYIIKFKAENNKKQIDTTITMGIKLYCIFGVVALLIVYIASNRLDVFYPGSINSENLAYAKTLFCIMGATTSISLLSHALTGVETAYEKYVITKIVYIVRQCGRVLLIYILLHCTSSAMVVVVSDLIITIVLACFDLCYCKFVLHVPIFRGKWDGTLLRSLFSFSFFAFIQIIITQINNGLDRMILGRYSTLEYVALYGVVMQLYSLFNSIGNVVCSVTLPKISEVVFLNGTEEQVTRCCTHYSRYQLHISGFIFGGFIILGKEFIGLWVPEYNASDVYLITLLIVTPQILESVEGTIFNVMKAKNMQAIRSLLLLGVAVFNVILSVILIQYFPLYGAAMGTCISFILGNTILSNIYYHKKVGIDLLKYFKGLFYGIAPVWIVMLLLGHLINCLPFEGIYGFFVKGIIYSLIYLGLILKFGLNDAEKKIVVSLKRRIKVD